MELRKIRGQTLPTGILSEERSDPSKFIHQPGERSQDAPENIISQIKSFFLILFPKHFINKMNLYEILYGKLLFKFRLSWGDRFGVKRSPGRG